MLSSVITAIDSSIYEQSCVGVVYDSCKQDRTITQ